MAKRKEGGKKENIMTRRRSWFGNRFHIFAFLRPLGPRRFLFEVSYFILFAVILANYWSSTSILLVLLRSRSDGIVLQLFPIFSPPASHLSWLERETDASQVMRCSLPCLGIRYPTVHQVFRNRVEKRSPKLHAAMAELGMFSRSKPANMF